MELQLANKLQHHIADLMWKAKSRKRVKDIINVYGVDAEIVLTMMLAAHYDEMNDTDIAEEILERFKNGA